MALPLSHLRTLLQEASRRPFQGKILTLGRQTVHFDQKALQKMAQEYGVSLRTPQKVTPPLSEKYAKKGCLSDEDLFYSLGFSEFVALDNSGYENAHIIFDLNQPSPPKHLRGYFDVILDSGTMEHVFHIPNVLSNIFHMLRPQGRIIQFLPSSNFMDHGFYMFSPTFLYEYYLQNNFQINISQIFRTTPLPRASYKVYNYTPGCLYHIQQGGLDSGVYQIVNIVTKEKDSTCTVIPQQKDYQVVWRKEKMGDAVSPNDPVLVTMFRQPLKKLAKRFVPLHKLYVRFFRKKGLGLKVVEEYKDF